MENNSNNVTSKKSRDLSILDFYEILQVEWICADLRRKIYPKIKDKNYWTKVAEGKKNTILRLAEKNSLPSIFDDESMLRIFEKKVYRENAYPDFVYKNEDNKIEQEYWDLHYYLYIYTQVRVNVAGEIKLGKITKEFIPYKDRYVMVTIEGEEKPYSPSLVTRIL